MSDKKVPILKISEEDMINIQSVSSKEIPVRWSKSEGDYIIPFIYMWEHLHESESEAQWEGYLPLNEEEDE